MAEEAEPMESSERGSGWQVHSSKRAYKVDRGTAVSVFKMRMRCVNSGPGRYLIHSLNASYQDLRSPWLLLMLYVKSKM